MSSAIPGLGRPLRLVGRDEEQGRLGAWTADAAAGRGVAALVEGGPGIGKSALLDVLAGEAAGAGVPVLAGRAQPDGWATSLAAVCGAVGARPDAEEPRLAEIARLAAPDAPGDHRRPTTRDDRAAATEMLLSWVDEQTARQPLVLVLDDAQWADDASLETWRQLCRAAQSSPLLAVAAWRPVREPTAAAAALRRTVLRHGELLPVAGLPADAVDTVVHDALGAPAGPRLRAVLAGAHGNPQRLHTLLAGLAGRVVVTRGTAELTDPRAGAEQGTGLLETLGAALSPDAREVAQAAAVLGTEFQPTDLAAVLDRPAADLLGPVQELTGLRLLLDRPAALRFQHDLVRDALYDAIPATERPAAHERTALALVRTGAPADRVADQVLRGPRELAPALVDWAFGVSPALVTRASPVAVDLLVRVRDSLPADDPRVPVADLLVGAGLLRAGRLGDAVRQLRELCRPELPPFLLVEVRWLLTYALMGAGDGAAAAAELAAGLADPTLEPERATSFRAQRAQALFMQGDFPGATEVAESVCRELPPSDPVAAFAAATLGLVDLVTGRETAAAERLGQALASLPELSGDAYDDPRQQLLHALGWVRVAHDDLEAAARDFTQGRLVAERSGGYLLPPLIVGSAFAAYHAGRWDELLGDVDEGLAGPDNTGTHRALLALATLVADHRGTAPPLGLPEVEALPSPESALPAFGWEMCRVLARTAWHESRGEPRAALEVLTAWLSGEATATFVRYLSRDFMGAHAVRLATALGEEELARSLAADIARQARRLPTPARRAAADYCGGLVAADPTTLAECAVAYRRAGWPVAAARADEEASVLWASRGDEEPARLAGRRAGQGYAALGAATDRRRLADRLRALGIARLRVSALRPATGWDSLTPVELAVAEQVAAGRSNPEAAVELRLSRRQVQSYVSQVLAKLELSSRVEIGRALAARDAARTGG